ncbi:hypothetical protein C0389_01080 [bacterium]|nr:hypothetical protein [bacterium]
MKLKYRLTLIAFLIVIIISVTSTFIFYSLAGRLLMQQQSKNILYSTNDFAFVLQSELSKPDEDFKLIAPFISNINKINLDSTAIDFCFTLVNDSLINQREFKLKTKSFLNIRSSSFRQFFSDNPNVVLRYAQFQNGKTVYYGSQITSHFLDRISGKIRAEVALVINDAPVETSNSDKNQINLPGIINAARELKFKNSFDLYSREFENVDFVASLFIPKFLLTPGGKINFIVFNVFKEGVEFRNTLRDVMVLIVIAGSALTFLIVIGFTIRLRRQIELLSEAAEITGKGNLDHRVEIITNDEIGMLGGTFNRMLDELLRNKKAEKEYSEFITLINQNPTMQEISDAALSKIIKTTGLTFGVLYIVEHKSLRLISSFGLSKKFIELTQNADLYSNAIEKKEKVEFKFHDNYPEIKTGIASIKIKYLTIYPIIYNKETIAVLELASESIPNEEVVTYIDNIHEQLAVGLINAKSFEQLENFVNELKTLNEEYQKQNEQIIKQNEQLKELHSQIQEKAGELEKQRSKAVELTRVKSDFLASMSHELRTPLISILGLTELLMKDNGVAVKTNDRLKIVHRNGKKLLSLINNILEFSKFESGKIEIKKESFLLSDLLDELYPNIEQLTTEKNLKFVLNIENDKNILISTDKAKLEQILLNLLVNAVKFTEHGSIQLVVSIHDENEAEFSVIDTGIGLSEENKKVIFSEFQQVDGSTSRKYGGAGLGLAICKKYVELLGGVLVLQSELGKGSKFSFALPDSVLDTFDTPAHQFLTLIGDGGDEPPIKTILIINANQDSLKLINDYLASYNYKIFATSKREDGISLAKKEKPDAIILDPFIHDQNVWSIILELRNNKITADIPIVLTMIIQESKVGWEPEIFDFVSLEFPEVVYEGTIRKVEIHYERQVRKIVVIDKSDSVYQVLRNISGTEYELQLVKKIEGAVKKIREENPQLIFVDCASCYQDIFQLSMELSQNRLTKNIPLVLILPREFSEEQINTLNAKLREITLKVKAHPLDVLKVLRDRLKMDDDITNKKINLIQESLPAENEKYPVKSGKKEDKAKPTILIVDDDNDALFTIGEFVKEMNCDTIFAHNGMECLLMLNHIEPDLIFLDIMMPQMDGFETIKRIRNEKRFAGIPIIALTAYAMLDNKNIIENNGFDDLVTKPINSQLLAAKMIKFLKIKID